MKVNPDPRMRAIGLIMMVIGVLDASLAVALILRG